MQCFETEILKSAISLKIKDCFTQKQGDIFIYPTIYKEQILQGFKRPCFFIWVFDISQTKLLNNNYERLYQMNIRYHTDKDDLKEYESLSNVGNKLLRCLEYIKVPTITGRVEGKINTDLVNIRGDKLSYKINEDVLHFYVNYLIKGRFNMEENAVMESLTINEDIGG